MAQYVYTSESGSRIISDHGSDVLNSQSDERQFRPRIYGDIEIEDFVYESWPPLLRYGGGASVDYYDSPITSIVCQGGICIYSYEAGNKSETVGQHGASTLSFLAARRISSFQTNIGSRTEVFKFISATESRLYNYSPHIVEAYGEFDYGLITANVVNSEDYGNVNTVHGSGEADYGHILHTVGRTRFGFVKKIGEAQARATNAWIGSGRIKKFGRQVSPAVWGAIADGKVRIFGAGSESIPRFYTGEGGTVHITNEPVTVGLTAITTGDGSLRKFGGSAESSTFNPDEKQMLFSFTGGLISEKHSETWVGSGRLRNFAKLEAEKGTFDYEGSGSLKLRPRKPSLHLLSDLANFTLEVDQDLAPHWEGARDPDGEWNETTKLGAVQLKELTEWSHEKHTECYTQTSFVAYNEVDYGLIVNQNLTTCTAVSGTISTNTTASTGCTKVVPGTTLAIAPGNTYTIPPSTTVPSSTIDYGNVADGHAPVIDHGWILDTSDLRTPYGRGLRFTSQVEVNVNHVYDWTSTGEPPIFRIFGQTALPVDVSEYGSGNLFAMGGAAETVSTAKVGTGLFKLLSLTDTTRARDFVGSGSLKKFSGLAESITWNPEEKQLLFSILGFGTEKHTEVYTGSGNLFAFSGASESTTYVPTLHGLFRFEGDSHETRARAIVGSGSLKKFSGLSESVAFNPLERQLLFSINGVGTEKHTEVYVGSGRLHSLSGSAESVRWSAQHTTGLYRISGDSIDTRARDFVGSGSLKKFSGLVESLTFNPLEKQMLFSFAGGITSEKHTEAYIGSGRIRNFASLDERQTFDYVGSGEISLLPRKPDCYELSELANFTLDTYVLRSSYLDIGNIDFYDGYTNLGDTKLKWIVCEQGHEKHTEAYNNSACEEGLELDYGFLINQANLNCVANSGTINTNTVAASGCIKVTPGTTLAIAPGSSYTIPPQTTIPTTSEDYGLVSQPNAPEVRDYGWILGSLSKKCPYGAFGIAGSAKTHFVENIVSTGYSVTGKAGVSIFGAGNTFWTPPYFGDGLFRTGGVVGESWIPWIPPGSGILWSMGGAAETTAVIWKGDGLFKIGSQAYTLFSLLHPGSGLIKVTGEGEEPRARAIAGSGSLKKFSGAAESATWNPEEKQMLFSFTGEHEVRFTANPPEEGAEIRLSGTTHPEILTFAEQPFGRIPVSGVGGTDRTRVFVGSGSLKKFSGLAESITFNPEEKQLLFSFLGAGTERVTLNPPEEGAEIRLHGESVVKATISQVGDIRIPIFGEGSTPWARPYIGSGSLKKFSGVAESITFNPEEKQLLFSFTGSREERTSITTIGSGRLFSFSGSVQVIGVAEEGTGLFRISGDASVKFQPVWIGSGSLKKFSGAAESITFNPEEKQLLFSFAGGITSEKHTESYVGQGTTRLRGVAVTDYQPSWTGSGTIRLSGDSLDRFIINNIGEGTIPVLSGAAESLTFNPEEKQMLFSFVGQRIAEKRTTAEIGTGSLRFTGTSGDPLITFSPDGSGLISISGIATTHYTPHIKGSGGLWTWSGAAESQAIAITSLPSLFRVYGDGHVSRTRPYTGSGSLRKLGGAAESLTFNPDEKQMLFSILGQGGTSSTRTEIGQGTVKTLGESTYRFSPVFFGSGTTELSGEATVTRTRDFVGFGTIPVLTGAAESISFNPEEKQMLFSFNGLGKDSTTTKLLSQGGVLTVRGTSGDPLLTFAEEPEVQVAISGDSYDIRAFGYQGSGRITNVNNADPSYVRAPYIGSGNITFSGIALVQVQLFQPPHTQVWII